MVQGSNALRPILGAFVPPKAERPKAGHIPPRKKWRFSLRYWRQIDFFGVGSCDNAWFVSLLERLAGMSQMELEQLQVDRNYKDAVRFHPINWNAKAIPLEKSDVDWLPDDYKTDEYELHQFHVSKGLGRVVGFFDEESTFQIVLLDPLHNLQPSKDFEYRVRATEVGQCELTRLGISYEQAIDACAALDANQKAALRKAIQEINLGIYQAAIFLAVSEGHLTKAYDLSATKAVQHIGELLEVTIDQYHADYIAPKS